MTAPSHRETDAPTSANLEAEYNQINDRITALMEEITELRDRRGHVLRKMVQAEQPGGVARVARRSKVSDTQIGRVLSGHLLAAVKKALREGGWEASDYELASGGNGYPSKCALTLIWDGEGEIDRLNVAGNLMYTLRQAGMNVLTDEGQGLDVDGYGPRSELADGNTVFVYWSN